MIHFNRSTPAPAQSSDNHRLRLTQRSLAATQDDNRRLRHAMDEAGRRIEELRAENENLVAENVRLTGQVHALSSSSAFLRKTVAYLEAQHDVDMRLAEAKDARIAELETQLAAALAVIEQSAGQD